MAEEAIGPPHMPGRPLALPVMVAPPVLLSHRKALPMKLDVMGANCAISWLQKGGQDRLIVKQGMTGLITVSACNRHFEALAPHTAA